MSELRDAYKKYAEAVREILRPATDADIARLMPAFHPLPLDTMTVGAWLDYRERLWQAVQICEIVGLLMEAEKHE